MLCVYSKINGCRGSHEKINSFAKYIFIERKVLFKLAFLRN